MTGRDRRPRGLVLSRVLDAPRELVWQAWTDPRHLARWLGNENLTARTDERAQLPDGRWRCDVVGADGVVVSRCELTDLGDRTRLTVELAAAAEASDRPER
jgi:uncharacterized protein YndB with AHSA1/START domain